MYGRTTKYLPDKGYGFIRGEDGNTYFIHHSKLNGEYIAINMLRITGTLAKGDTKREINTYIKELSDKLGYVKLKGKIDEKNLKQEINKSLHNMSFEDID